MASDPNSSKDPVLKAVYQAPRTSQETAEPSAHTFAQQLSSSIPPPGENSTAERTKYLAELRGSIVSLQADVNAFLTEKMEEDKLRDAQGAGTIDDKTEEDNYGEEVVDDDE